MDQTMKDLDLKKYMGKWYEIGHYKFRPEASCERAIAIYSLKDENTVRVENQCYKDNNLIRTRKATAWVTDPSDKGKLSILFDNEFDSELDTLENEIGNYYVHWTDYKDAIVGNSNDKLWWLSRKPTVKVSEVEPMLERIRSFGYNTDKLIGTKGVVTL